MPEERTKWTSSIANQGTWVGSSFSLIPSSLHTYLLRRVPLLEERGEPHCVITGLNSLYTAI